MTHVVLKEDADTDRETRSTLGHTAWAGIASAGAIMGIPDGTSAQVSGGLACAMAVKYRELE